VQRVGAPLAQFALRRWMALVFAICGSALIGNHEIVPIACGQWYLPILPVDGDSTLLGVAVALLAGALLFGLATRIAAVLLIGIIAANTSMGFGQQLEASHLVAQLALLVLAARSWLSVDHDFFTSMHQRYPLFEDLDQDQRANHHHAWWWLARVLAVSRALARYGGASAASRW